MAKEIYSKEFYDDDGELCLHTEPCNCHKYNALDFAKLLRSKLPDGQECVADIEDACYLIDQLQAELEKHRWIPVSEKLPKHGCSILARGKDGFGYEICAVVSYNLEFNKFRVLTDVTYWKPIILPESEVKE